MGDGEDLALVGLDGPEAELVAYCCAFRSSCAVELLDLVEAPRRDLLKQAAGALASRDRGRRLALLGRLLAPVWSEGGRRRLELALSEEPAWLASLAVPLVPGGARGRGGAPLPSACRAHPALTGLARRFVLRLLGG